MLYVPVGYTTPVQLAEGIQVTVVNAAVLPGTATSVPFTMPTGPGRTPMSLDYGCTGTFSVATIQIQESFDGGVTWLASGSVINVVTYPAGNISPLTIGPLYRLNVVTLTGTSITINVGVA
jgi:hypothetical protein